jgi:hypothetical protein
VYYSYQYILHNEEARHLSSARRKANKLNMLDFQSICNKVKLIEMTRISTYGHNKDSDLYLRIRTYTTSAYDCDDVAALKMSLIPSPVKRRDPIKSYFSDSEMPKLNMNACFVFAHRRTCDTTAGTSSAARWSSEKSQ